MPSRSFASLLTAYAFCVLMPETNASVSVSLDDATVASLDSYVYVDDGWSRFYYDWSNRIYHVCELKFAKDRQIEKNDKLLWWSTEASGAGYVNELYEYTPAEAKLSYKVYKSDEVPEIRGQTTRRKLTSEKRLPQAHSTCSPMS